MQNQPASMNQQVQQNNMVQSNQMPNQLSHGGMKSLIFTKYYLE